MTKSRALMWTTGTDGRKYSLIALDDNHYLILRDDVPLPEIPSSQCIQSFQSILAGKSPSLSGASSAKPGRPE